MDFLADVFEYVNKLKNNGMDQYDAETFINSIVNYYEDVFGDDIDLETTQKYLSYDWDNYAFECFFNTKYLDVICIKEDEIEEILDDYKTFDDFIEGYIYENNIDLAKMIERNQIEYLKEIGGVEKKWKIKENGYNYLIYTNNENKTCFIDAGLSGFDKYKLLTQKEKEIDSYWDISKYNTGEIDLKHFNEFKEFKKINLYETINDLVCEIKDYNITSLDVSNKDITKIIGLEKCKDLEKLNCGFNKLSTLDVSKNKNLKELYCWDNELSTLDVSQNKNLKELNCSENRLSTLDVSKNKYLEKLNCSTNLIFTLDLSNNPNLQKLKCSENKLKSLDLSNNPNLQELHCGKNDLSTLDLSNNKDLQELYCYKNNLTSLDVSNNKKLQWLNYDEYATKLIKDKEQEQNVEIEM